MTNTDEVTEDLCVWRCPNVSPCPDHDHSVTDEPTRFAWIRDGELVAGTLADWAKMWESDYYAGDNDLTHTLLTWDGESDPVRCTVSVQKGKATDNWTLYRIIVPGFHDTVTVFIDERA